MASKANIYTYEENCNTLSISILLEWTWKVKYPELRRNLKGIARGNSTKKLIHIIQEKQRGRYLLRNRTLMILFCLLVKYQQ